MIVALNKVQIDKQGFDRLERGSEDLGTPAADLYGVLQRGNHARLPFSRGIAESDVGVASTTNGDGSLCCSHFIVSSREGPGWLLSAAGRALTFRRSKVRPGICCAVFEVIAKVNAKITGASSLVMFCLVDGLEPEK